MTTEPAVQFSMARSFVPFVFSLVNGREVEVSRSEQVLIGRYALVVTFIHPTRPKEVFDVSHIVSIRTVYDASSQRWIG